MSEIYGTEISADLVYRVTDSVVDELKQWQQPTLNAVYPIVYLDALVVKVCDQGIVQNKAAGIAIGVTIEGTNEVLGIWMETNEGAKFWLKVINEIRNRGVQDMLIVCCDGLKGFPEAFDAKRGKRVPTIVQSWRPNWERLTPFLAFPRDIRRLIYMTNAIESLNSSLRRAVKTRRHFPNDTAAAKRFTCSRSKYRRNGRGP